MLMFWIFGTNAYRGRPCAACCNSSAELCALLKRPLLQVTCSSPQSPRGPPVASKSLKKGCKNDIPWQQPAKPPWMRSQIFWCQRSRHSCNLFANMADDLSRYELTFSCHIYSHTTYHRTSQDSSTFRIFISLRSLIKPSKNDLRHPPPCPSSSKSWAFRIALGRSSNKFITALNCRALRVSKNSSAFLSPQFQPPADWKISRVLELKAKGLEFCWCTWMFNPSLGFFLLVTWQHQVSWGEHLMADLPAEVHPIPSPSLPAAWAVSWN